MSIGAIMIYKIFLILLTMKLNNISMGSAMIAKFILSKFPFHTKKTHKNSVYKSKNI